MRLRGTHKKILAGLLTFALIVPGVIMVKGVKASETQVPFAQSADGTAHESSFALARVSDDNALSSYEEDNGKHWVKLFSKFDGEKNIFDEEELPDDTAKVKVVFDITNYDLDEAYPLTWATGIGGWTSGKPTGVTIDQSGTYEAVLDFASETDGLGRTISGADISAASVQLVFQLGEKNQENIANVKKTQITFKACYAYSASDEVTQTPVVPIVENTPTPVPTSQVTPTPVPTSQATQMPVPTSQVTATPIPTNSPQATGKPSVDGDGSQNTTTPNKVTSAPSIDGNKTTAAPKANKVKKIKAAKKSVVIKKGKTKKVLFRLTTTDKSKKTTDKITKVKVSNKKIAKVTQKSLGKKTCVIKVKGCKKGKTVLTVKIGKKQAKVKIKIK